MGTVMRMEVYFDNSSTTSPYPEVIETYAKAMKEFYGNSESLHGIGARARKMLENGRAISAELLGVLPEEIIFTSGGTESNNLGIYGAAHAYRGRGNHLITSAIEHPSVLNVFSRLEKEGFEVTYLPVSKEGMVQPEEVMEAITPKTTLISLMYVNNEIGSLQPIAEVGQIIRNHPKIIFHVDAVQAFGKVPLKIKEWGIHLLSLSGHKFHGPKGVGLLYKEKKIQLMPTHVGGGQEFGLRPGTVNVPGIIAMVKAMRISRDREEEFLRLIPSWKERLMVALQTIPNLQIHTPAKSAPHILHFTLPPLRGETLLHALEEEGIYVSTRSACSGRRKEMSHVLRAIGLPEERALASIRISLSLMNREEEVQYAEKIFREKLLSWIEKMEEKR